MYDDWFEDDELDGSQAVFVDVVRASARSWPQCPPAATAVLVFGPDEDDESDEVDIVGSAREGVWVPPAEHAVYHAALDEALDRGDTVVTLIADLRDTEKRVIFRTLGATVIGDRLFCSERHSQNYQSPEPVGDIEPVCASGPPEHLGQVAAAWFEEIMNRLAISRHVLWAPAFVPRGTPLPPGYRWARNGPAPCA
ncbi:hypothetical protein [Streptomyces sp. NPDC127038]|uniref:hypothetical protein n=1 Tax=Streptomyces sp. NPDC127038 TaxID=3347114 RepID=UPI003652758A